MCVCVCVCGRGGGGGWGDYVETLESKMLTMCTVEK